MALSIESDPPHSRRGRGYYRVLVAVCGALLLLGSIKYESTTVPEWDLRVINPRGEPLSGVQVYQTWKHYSLDSSDTFNREIKVTDETGRVSFPRRTVNASLLRRVLSSVGRWVNINPHASFGPHAHISIHRGGNTYVADYEEGERLPSELTVDN